MFVYVQQCVDNIHFARRVNQSYERIGRAVSVPDGIEIVIVGFGRQPERVLSGPVDWHQHRVVQCGIEHLLLVGRAVDKNPVEEVFPLLPRLFQGSCKIPSRDFFFDVAFSFQRTDERDADFHLDGVRSWTGEIHEGPGLLTRVELFLHAWKDCFSLPCSATVERAIEKGIKVNGIGFPVVPATSYPGISFDRSIGQYLNLRTDKLLCLARIGNRLFAKERSGVYLYSSSPALHKPTTVKGNTLRCGEFESDIPLL